MSDRWNDDEYHWAKPLDQHPAEQPSLGAPVSDAPSQLGVSMTAPGGESGSNAFAVYRLDPYGHRRPLRTLSRIVVVLLGLSALTSVYTFYAQLEVSRFLDRAAEGRWVTEAEALEIDERVLTSFWVWLAVTVATGVVFAVWFWRLRINAGLMAPQLQRRSQGWAFWGWIVPIVSFWFPVQIALDAVRSAPAQPRSRPTVIIVGWWWALWLGSGLVASAGNVGDLTTLEGLSTATTFAMVAEVLMVVAAVLAIVAVRALTALQEPRSLSDSPIAERLPDDGGSVG